MNHHHNNKMPPWASRIDSFGNRYQGKEKSYRSRRGEYIGTIISNLVFLWIINNVQSWHLGFLKDNFIVVLWILDVNILIQVGANLLMLMYESTLLRRLAIILSETAKFIATLVLYIIYPFDFQNFHGLFWLDWFLPFVFIISMIFCAAKVFSNAWKLIFYR